MILAGESKLPYGQVPIMLHNGEVTLQTSSGKVATVMLDTHNFDEKLQDQSSEEVRKGNYHVYCLCTLQRLILPFYRFL